MAVPIITTVQMRAWEQAAWAAGRNEQAVIEQVGLLVARRALRLTREGDRILIVAGKGHNGDDARHAAPHLERRTVRVLNIEDPAAAREELSGALGAQPALILDGLFGIGLNRALSPEWIHFIDRINHSEIPVLAVDVPSGLNADTGRHHGTAMRAELTLTLGAPKCGLLRRVAWPYVGRLELASDIGLGPCPHSDLLQWTLAEDFAGYPPRRPIGGHKGTFGHAVIFAGSVGYHGAAVLAARGAQRAQPGLITVMTTTATYGPVASHLQSAMVRPWVGDEPGGGIGPPGGTAEGPTPAGLTLGVPSTATAMLFGPGLAAPHLPPSWRHCLTRSWLESPLPMVVDASALDWLPPGPVVTQALRVITPHPGEAGRLLGVSTNEIQEDRPKALRELSARYGGCAVVLKGNLTLVGSAESVTYINATGNPLLAQGGSGDVLAGYLAGLLAQPALQADSLRTLRYAAWQHGLSAEVLTAQRPHWIVEELVNVLGSAQPAALAS